jgi:hypothetical protein
MNKKVKEKLKSACEESDRKERVERVSKILEAVKYPTETDRAAAILSFSKANLSLEQIETLVKPLRPDYLEGQIYKRGLY